jgi:hypothetical protein
MCGNDCRTASAVPWYQFSDEAVCSAASSVTKPARKRSNRYDRAMWLFRLAERYCVSTKMRSSPELMQLEMGTSTNRYLPANGTAGLARSLVSGKRRVPAPPPMMTAIVCFISTGWGREGSVKRSAIPTPLCPPRTSTILPHHQSEIPSPEAGRGDNGFD